MDIDEKYFSALLKNAHLKDEIVDKVCEFLGIIKEDYFSPDAEPIVADGGGAYKKKYEELLGKHEGLMDTYMVEKTEWLKERHSAISKENELRSEHFKLQNELIDMKSELLDLKNENRLLREKLGKYETNTDTSKAG